MPPHPDDLPGAYQQRIETLNNPDVAYDAVNSPHDYDELKTSRSYNPAYRQIVQEHLTLAPSLQRTQCLPYYPRDPRKKAKLHRFEEMSGRLLDVTSETGKRFGGPKFKTEVLSLVDPSEADGEIALQMLSKARQENPKHPYDIFERTTQAYAIFQYDETGKHPVTDPEASEEHPQEPGDFRLIKIVTNNDASTKLPLLVYQETISEDGVTVDEETKHAFLDEYARNMENNYESVMKADCKANNVDFETMIDHIVVRIGREWNKDTQKDDGLAEKDSLKGNLKELVDKYQWEYMMSLSESTWDWRSALKTYSAYLSVYAHGKEHGFNADTEKHKSAFRQSFVDHLSSLYAYNMLLHYSVLIASRTGNKPENPMQWSMDFITDWDKTIAGDIQQRTEGVEDPLLERGVSMGRLFGQPALKDVELLIMPNRGNKLLVVNTIGEDRPMQDTYAYEPGNGVAFDGRHGAFPHEGLEESFGHSERMNTAKGIAALVSGLVSGDGSRPWETERYMVVDLLKAKGKYLFALAIQGLLDYPGQEIPDNIWWTDLHKKVDVHPLPTLIGLDPKTDEPVIKAVIPHNTSLEIVTSSDGSGMTTYPRSLYETVVGRRDKISKRQLDSSSKGNKKSTGPLGIVVNNNMISKDQSTHSAVTFAYGAVHVWKARNTPGSSITMMPSEKRYKRSERRRERSRIT